MELVDANLVIDLTQSQSKVFHPCLLEDFAAKGVYLQECSLKKLLKW